MATCAECGYELQPFEETCPKCQRLAEQGLKGQTNPEAVQPTDRPARQPPAPSDGSPHAAEAQPSGQAGQPTRSALAASGAVAGALYCSVLLTTYILVDRWFFDGSESAGLGLVGAILSAGVAGAVLGALIGAATMMARATGAGIAAGEIVLGVGKGAGVSLSGYGSGFVAFGLAVGMVYGALIGWVVSTSVMKSIKWP
jgi:hypothetical protein